VAAGTDVNIEEKGRSGGGSKESDHRKKMIGRGTVSRMGRGKSVGLNLGGRTLHS